MIRKAASCLLAGSMLVGSFAAVNFPAFAEEDDVWVTKEVNIDGDTGLRIIGIRDGSLIKDGSLTIPDTLYRDGKDIPVISIGNLNDSQTDSSTFLGQYQGDVTEVTIGKNVYDVSVAAFYGADNLKAFKVEDGNKAVTTDSDGAALILNGECLIKYAPAAEKQSYTVPDKVTEVVDMSGAKFDTLDLNNTQDILGHSMFDTEVDTLVVKDAKNEYDGSTNILYGAYVKNFQAGGSTVYTVEDNALYAGDKLVKTSADAESVNPKGSVSPYAFSYLSQAEKTYSKYPGAFGNTVCCFHNQRDAVFFLNGKTGYCYNTGLAIPESYTGDAVEYRDGIRTKSRTITADEHEKVTAVLYAGIPADSLGLYKSYFGSGYQEYSGLEADNAKNALQCAIYYALGDDQKPDFGDTAANGYYQALVHVADNASQYNFTPDFGTAQDTLIRQKTIGDTAWRYSDPVTVSVKDADGNEASQYHFTMHITNADVLAFPQDTFDKALEAGTLENLDGSSTFKSGEPVVFMKADGSGLPEELAFTYDVPEISFYFTDDADAQDVLAAGTKTEQASLTLKAVTKYIQISKQAVSGTDELPGAELTLTDKGGSVIDSWTSGDAPHAVKNPANGEYTLTETAAPGGYETAESITFSVTDGEIDAATVVNGTLADGILVMKDAQKADTLEISKRDMASGDELPGAKLTLTDKDGRTVDTWISGDTPHTIQNPADGEYTLTEQAAPDGYETAESITFTITGGKVDQGSAPDGAVSGNTVIMKDAPVSVPGTGSIQISKRDIATGEELPGAELTLTGADGSVIDEWVSTDTPYEVKELPDGAYTLAEKQAPDGYQAAEAITFAVQDGKPVPDGGSAVIDGRIVMKDAPVGKIPISKQDAVTGKELPGAELTLTDENGREVESWTSGDTPHVVTLPDGDYTLAENAAPLGYSKTESVTFTVQDGKVSGDKVIMYDAPERATPPDIATPAEIRISKKDAATGNELPGAVLVVTDENGKEIERWTSSDKPHTVSLDDGNYKLTEITAPNGYETAETIAFTVSGGRVSGDKVVMLDKPKTPSSSGGGGGSSHHSSRDHSSSSRKTPTSTTAPTTPTTPTEAPSDTTAPETTPEDKPVSTPIRLPKTGDFGAALMIFQAAAGAMIIAITKKEHSE